MIAHRLLSSPESNAHYHPSDARSYSTNWRWTWGGMERITGFGGGRYNIILIHCDSHLSRWPKWVMYRVALFNQQDTAKIMMCNFQGWDIKDTGFHSVLLLGSLGSGGVTMWDTQVALWRYTHVVKGLRSPA